MKTKPEAKATPMWKLSVRLDDGLATRLKVQTAKERRTLQAVVTAAIEHYLKAAKGGER